MSAVFALLHCFLYLHVPLLVPVSRHREYTSPVCEEFPPLAGSSHSDIFGMDMMNAPCSENSVIFDFPMIRQLCHNSKDLAKPSSLVAFNGASGHGISRGCTYKCV